MMIGMAIAAKAVKNKGNTNCIFCDIDFGMWILDCGMWIADFGMWIADCGICDIFQNKCLKKAKKLLL
jgi:hypothetical protein